MIAHWEGEADSYDLRRKWSPVDTRVIEILTALEFNSLLEIGCGTALVAAKLLKIKPQARYIGLDLAENFLKISRNRLGKSVSLVKADTTFLPFVAASWDGIIEMNAIHHFPQGVLTDIVQEISRILRPGGCFLVVEDWAGEPDTEIEQIAYQLKNLRPLTHLGLEYHPSEAEWLEIFNLTGLTPIHREYLKRPLGLDEFASSHNPHVKPLFDRLGKLCGDQQPTTSMVLFHCIKG